MDNATEDDTEGTGLSTTTLYLVIAIPIAILLVIIVVCSFWLYIKRSTPRHPIRFKSLKNVPHSQHYKIFSNPQILEDYIRQNTTNQARSTHVSEQGTTRPTRPTFITVPNGGDTSMHSSHRMTTASNAKVEPYIIPVRLQDNNVGEIPNHQYPSPHDESVTVFRMPSKENTSTPSKTRTENHATARCHEDTFQYHYAGSSSEHLDRSNIDYRPDGSVIIHVDNISKTSKYGSSVISAPRTRSLTPNSFKGGSWTDSDGDVTP